MPRCSANRSQCFRVRYFMKWRPLNSGVKLELGRIIHIRIHYRGRVTYFSKIQNSSVKRNWCFTEQAWNSSFILKQHNQTRWLCICSFFLFKKPKLFRIYCVRILLYTTGFILLSVSIIRFFFKIKSAIQIAKNGSCKRYLTQLRYRCFIAEEAIFSVSWY